MTTIADIRRQYPQYHDLSDDQLATALHQKFYADMPEPEFRAKIGLAPAYQPTGPGAISEATDAAAVRNATGDSLLAALRGGIQGGKDYIGGLARGAADIGIAITAPLSSAPMAQRRANVANGLRKTGVNPDSTSAGIGRSVMHMAGTSGVGPLLGGGARAIPFVARTAPAIIDAIETGGFSANGLRGLPAVVPRMVGGAVNGGVTAAAINPHEAGSGALIGAALPVAGQVVGAAAVKAGQFASQGIRRSPEAQRLLDAGVELTPGMMEQGGTLNGIEQTVAGTQIPFLSEAQRKAREAARASLQRAVVEHAAAPGTKIALKAPDEMLDDAYRSFEPLYRQAKNIPVPPQVRGYIDQAFDAAASDPSVAADAATRSAVGDWLKNKATMLDGGKRLTTTQLLQLRSDIREQIRNYGRAKESVAGEKADLFRVAEDRVTEILRRTLPKDALKALITADRQYGKYKIVEDAVQRAKDNPNGFSPDSLTNAIYAATKKSAYARGGGGSLRRMSRDAKATITDTAPRTGALIPGFGVLGALKPYVAAPLVAGQHLLTTTQTGRRLAAGNTRAQQFINNLSLPASLNALTTPGGELLPRAAVPLYLSRPDQ